MKTAGVIVLIIVIVLLAGGVGWVIHTRMRAQRLGVSYLPGPAIHAHHFIARHRRSIVMRRISFYPAPCPSL